MNNIGFTIPALPNHPGRAALISGPKRQSISHKTPTANRSITSNSTSASSPAFSNIQHIRSYSLSRAYSDQPSHTGSDSSIPSSSRRTSISDKNDKSRRSNSQMVRAPQSLCESHEQPASLLEQPSLLEKVNIQILSPNRDRTHPPFFGKNDLGNGKSKSEENLNTAIENDNRTIQTTDVNENK